MKNNRKGAKAPVIVAVVVALMATALIVGVVIDDSTKAGNMFPDWYYLDSYVEAVKPVNPLTMDYSGLAQQEDNVPIVLGINPRISAAFASAREVVKEKFGNYTNFNWERFERTQILEGSENLHDGCDAMYYPEKDTAYAFQELKKLSDKEMEKVLAHELIHALTGLNEESRTTLYEGLTEYMSTLLYGEEQVSYEIPVRFVQLYAERYGLDAAIELFQRDSCYDTLDNLMGKPGAMGNIELLLRATSFYFDQNANYVTIDVMTHFCKSIDGNPEIVKGLFNVYLPKATKEDLSYFNDVLGR